MFDGLSLAAAAVVGGFGLVMCGLALWIWISPDPAERFLLAFASSARAHFLEQSLRLLFGLALLIAAPRMPSELFAMLGWVVVVTTALLLILPWRWHQRFAVLVMPTVVRFKRLYAVALLGMGSLLLWAMLSAFQAQ